MYNDANTDEIASMWPKRHDPPEPTSQQKKDFSMLIIIVHDEVSDIVTSLVLLSVSRMCFFDYLFFYSFTCLCMRPRKCSRMRSCMWQMRLFETVCAPERCLVYLLSLSSENSSRDYE